jgi:hypothetical protein
MFPELDISDADLEDAVTGEAANADFHVGLRDSNWLGSREAERP